MIDTLINRQCVITHRSPSGSVNRYGDKVKSETSVSTVCELQQRRRSEGEDETSDTRWIVFLLPHDRIHSGDSITVEGETYEVEGEPWRARNPRTQAVHHVEATVRRTAGAGDEVGS